MKSNNSHEQNTYGGCQNRLLRRIFKSKRDDVTGLSRVPSFVLFTKYYWGSQFKEC
jgi:hypothetical protein